MHQLHQDMKPQRPQEELLPRSGDHPASSEETWLSSVGSLGPRRRDSTLPKSNFAQEVSRALTSTLRHGNGPRIKVTPSGFAELPHVLRLPRLRKLHVSPGDILEIVRSSEKDRFELQQSGRRSTSELFRGILAVMWTRVRHINLSTLLIPGGHSSQRTHTRMVDAEVNASEIKECFSVGRRNDTLHCRTRSSLCRNSILPVNQQSVLDLTPSAISPTHYRGTRH